MAPVPRLEFIWDLRDSQELVTSSAPPEATMQNREKKACRRQDAHDAEAKESSQLRPRTGVTLRAQGGHSERSVCCTPQAGQRAALGLSSPPGQDNPGSWAQRGTQTSS